jgi:hypothetical protein
MRDIVSVRKEADFSIFARKQRKPFCGRTVPMVVGVFQVAIYGKPLVQFVNCETKKKIITPFETKQQLLFHSLSLSVSRSLILWCMFEN